MKLDMRGVDYFQGELVPSDSGLAGWAALVHGLKVEAPVRSPSVISLKYVRGSQRQEGGWRVFDKRYGGQATFADHLNFAMRHELLDLLVLSRVLQAVPQTEIEAFIRSAPTGSVTRRVWFFYEFLTGRTLNLADAGNVTAVDAIDPQTYFTVEGHLSKRHRVRNNLPGVAEFCPLIRRTEKLERLIGKDLSKAAHQTVGRTGKHLMARAASFMLLADSRASFAIEGERPPHNRLERWGRAVLEAGRRPLNQTEIYRLHRILIGDDRFTRIGYRTEGVFLGERDHDNQPLPEFIGARPDDLPDLMNSFSACNEHLRQSGLDAVLQAAAIAFGFVYIHPLADGNGRMHRCLIHHVLAERGFAPTDMVFPVSSVMLDRIDDYRTTLQSHTAPLMEFIDWQPTPDGNVAVVNKTADLYRYFDCTQAAEFLFDCVEHTVEQDLPREIDYLRRHDEALHQVMNLVEMPDRLAESLILFIRQNDGSLSRKRREREFASLTDAELTAIEQIVRDAFAGF